MNKRKAIPSWKLIFQIDTWRSPFQRRGGSAIIKLARIPRKEEEQEEDAAEIQRGRRGSGQREETRFYGGTWNRGSRWRRAIKKLGARFQDRTGIGCVLPKAGKRRDGARMSGANGSPSFCQFQLTSIPRIRSTKPQAFLSSFRHPVQFSTAAIQFSKNYSDVFNIFFPISLLFELLN